MLIIQGANLTPNPQAIKFLLNRELLKKSGRNYKNIDEAKNDPFAAGILGIDGVESLFYTGKFITIQKKSEVEWPDLERRLAKFLLDFNVDSIPPEFEESKDKGSALLEKIETVIDERIRPALANDGGGLEILTLEGKLLKIRYHGACHSCPGAIRGTLMAIEALLKREVDQEIEVMPG